jgi:tetratricopeptide (TPR) repeat protein
MAQKTEKTEAMQTVGVCVFLVLMVLAVFGQTAGFEFVNYDDDKNVFENAVVEKGLSMQALGWAFTHPQVSNWIPLTTLSHILDCQLFGLHAGGHHLVNVLWHAATVVLLFLVLRQMTGSLWRSAFVAAIFAVHPLRAESVAWVSERKDVLSGFFFILTIGAYVRHARKPSRSGYIAVVLLFALGLLAKSMVATLPFVLLLLDYWPLGRLHDARLFPALVREMIPLLAVAAADCVATAMMPGLLVPHRLPLLQRVGNAVVSYVVYLRQMVWPTGLASPYPIAANGQSIWTAGLALGLLAAISTGVLLCRKKSPWLLVGWLWYLGMLFPVIGIIQISADTAYADRYTYLPGIGLALAGTWAVADVSLWWKYRRVILSGLMMAVIGTFIGLGHAQTSYWRDSETLWRRALSCTANNHVAHYNLGIVFLQRGEQEKATTEFRKAVASKPDYVPALNNLGGTLAAKGSNVEAIAQYRKALEFDPTYEIAHFNLGQSLIVQGQIDEAIPHFRKALEIRPDYADAHYGLGTALFSKKQWGDSIAHLRKALEIKPDFPEARRILGRALLCNGDIAEAMTSLEKPGSMDSDLLTRWSNLGHDFLQENNLEEAIACYGQAIKINPRSADARAYLGLASYKNGQIKEAIDAWEQTLEIQPDLNNIRNNLAWLLATTPDASLRNGAKGVALAEEASKLNGGSDAAVLHTLAAAYAEAGRYGDATATARRALVLAVAQDNSGIAAKLQKEIKLYEANTPMRDPPK